MAWWWRLDPLAALALPADDIDLLEAQALRIAENVKRARES